MRVFVLLTCGLLLLAPAASASSGARDPWNVWGATPPAGAARPVTPLFDASMAPVALATEPADQTAAPAKVVVDYSDAYRLRAKIHKYSSFAMLPLFATEVALGQSLYNNGGEGSRRSAHAAVGAGIGVLFGVNTVTGGWNLWEARKDPNGRARRIAHGLLMMAADAGFLATAALAPSSESEHGLSNFDSNRSAHRTVALTSMGLATAGYLIMLIGGR